MVVKLRDPGHIYGLCILCWLLYFAANLGRLNLSVNISAIVQNEGISRDALGLMASLFFLTYGSGQLLCGIIAERFNAVVLAAIGASLSCAANLVTAAADSITIMQLSWMMNGLGQSFIWIPMARILTESLAERQCVRAFVHLSITGPVGMFCIYGLSSLLLLGPGWRSVFLLSGLFMLLMIILWITLVPPIMGGNRSKKTTAMPGSSLTVQNSKPKWSVARVMTASGLGWFIMVSCLHGILKDGLNTWLPTYLVDNFRLNPSFSAVLTMVLPVCNITGVYLARYITKNILINETDCSIAFFFIVFLALLVLWFFPNTIFIALILFALATTMMTAINTVLITLIPLRYSQTGRIPTTIGFLNTAAYLGSGIAGYGFGNTVEASGWGMIRFLWCGTALSAIIICFIVRNKWGYFCRESAKS